MSDWYDSSGQIAERTNVVINGVLDWAGKEELDHVTRKNFEDAITALTPVDGDGTVRDYTERCVKHGPFNPAGVGLWTIDWDQVHETSKLEADQ